MSNSLNIGNTLTPVLEVKELPSPAFEPNGPRFLLLKDTVADITKEGIHITGSAKEVPRTGTIVVCGPACTVARRGDRIAFPPYVGTDISILGQPYLLMEEPEILGWLSHAEPLLGDTKKSRCGNKAPNEFAEDRGTSYKAACERVEGHRV